MSYRLTITTQVPYREGYNAIHISAIPHHKTVTLLTAYADSEKVLQQVADDFDHTRGSLTVSIEKLKYEPGLMPSYGQVEGWMKQTTSQEGE